MIFSACVEAQFGAFPLYYSRATASNESTGETRIDEALGFALARNFGSSRLPKRTRIHAIANCLARLFCPLAGQGKTNARIRSEAERIASTLVGVVEPPAVRPALDEQAEIQTAPIAESSSCVAMLDGPESGV